MGFTRDMSGTLARKRLLLQVIRLSLKFGDIAASGVVGGLHEKEKLFSEFV